jgi:sporadic carbohydrate cluster protein (TIGR04323 family)
MDNLKPIEVINGYVTVRSFGGMAIPVPIQNMILRNYCAGLKAIYHLPMNEHKYEGCFMQYFATINAVKENGHIAMCSVFMLPESKSLFEEAKQKVLEKNITIHSIFENLKVSDEAGFENIESIIKLRAITDQIDKNEENILEYLKVYA